MRLRSILLAVAVVALLSAPAVRAADVLLPTCETHAAASLDALTHGGYASARKDFGEAIAIAAWLKVQAPR